MGPININTDGFFWMRKFGIFSAIVFAIAGVVGLGWLGYYIWGHLQWIS